jgi:mRNA interferase MazF
MDMVTAPSRGAVYLVALDPTKGAEMAKTRPCAVVSPDELNRHLATVTIVPMTSAARRYRFRVATRFENTEGALALDQIRTVDKSRLVKHLGALDAETQRRLRKGLQEMFA